MKEITSGPQHILEVSELYNKMLQTKAAWETKVSLIKAAIQNGDYVIHPEHIINQMLSDIDTRSTETVGQ